MERISLSNYFLETHSSITSDVISIEKIIKELSSSSEGISSDKRQSIVYKTPGTDYESEYLTFKAQYVQYNQQKAVAIYIRDKTLLVKLNQG